MSSSIVPSLASVLAVVAPPGDEILSCGDTLALHAQRVWAFEVVQVEPLPA